MQHDQQTNRAARPAASPAPGAEVKRARGQRPLVARIIPPASFVRREEYALEQALSTLSLSSRSPVALELVAEGERREFLARATTPEATRHLLDQLQALYPQARIEPLAEPSDPLRLQRGEVATVVELAIQGPAYLSLKTPDPRVWGKNEATGADPLLAVLGALHQPPPACRVIVQLALIPAPSDWSKAFWRKAVEHPLDPERKREQARLRQTSARVAGPSTGMLVALGLLIVGALIARQFGMHLLSFVPIWVKQDLPFLLHGHLPPLTGGQLGQLVLVLGGLAALVLVVNRLLRHLHREPLYDMQAVANKARQVAYRASLRVIVIGPNTRGGAHQCTIPSSEPGATGRALAHVWQWMEMARGLGRRVGQASHTWPSTHQWTRKGHTSSKPLQTLAPWKSVVERGFSTARSAAHVLWHVLRVSARWIRRKVARGAAWLRDIVQTAQERRLLADRVVAAYRQYHQANGASFRPHLLVGIQANLIPQARQEDKPRRTNKSARKSVGRLVRRWLWWALFPVRLLARACSWLVLGRATWTHGVASSRWRLSIAELAALWHLLPEQDTPDIAGLERARARTRPLPTSLLTNEAPTSGNSTLIPYQVGTCTHAGQGWPVLVPQAVTTTSSLAIATTGKGKSTLFAHLALAHLLGHSTSGLFFMEPHGDTIANLLGCLPIGRREDVTLIDLADGEQVVGLNPLDMTQGIARDKTVDNILAVFAAIGRRQKNWGARMETITRMSLASLAEANLTLLARGEDPSAQYCLLDLAPLLQDQGYRDTVRGLVADPVIQNWWIRPYQEWRKDFREEIIAPVLNKLTAYSASQVSRRLLGQSHATVRLREDIREGRVILVNTASGVIGEELSALCGATLVGLFQAALAEQAMLPVDARRRFWVAIDEFQTYLGIDYPHLLAELRKYGGAFGLATQSLAFLDALDRTLRPAVLANADQLFTFAMSAEDAKELEPYLAMDNLEARDLLTLDAYSCYARLTVAGRRLPAFSLSLASPPHADPDVAWRVREHARARVARPVATVDAELAGETPAEQGEQNPREGRPHEDGESRAAPSWRWNHQGPAPRQSGRRRGQGIKNHQDFPLVSELREQESRAGKRQAEPIPLDPCGLPLTTPVVLSAHTERSGENPAEQKTNSGDDQPAEEFNEETGQ